MSKHSYSISVVIPNYNYEKYVGQAIESVLAQTCQPLEIIVVDDGSTDNSVNVVNRFGPPVKLVQQRNQHLSAARNTGIRAARGEWIALLDSDDTWDSRKLELQIGALQENPEWSYVATTALEAETFPTDSKDTVVSHELTLSDFLTVTPMSGSDALIKKACFEECGMFDPELKSCEDRDMWLRLAKSFRGGRVEEPLWRYRQHEDQMNRNFEVMIETRKQVLRRFFKQAELPAALHRKAWAHHYYDSSIAHRDNGGSLVRAASYAAATLLLAPGTYHSSATTGERIRSLAVTLLMLAGLKKRPQGRGGD